MSQTYESHVPHEPLAKKKTIVTGIYQDSLKGNFAGTKIAKDPVSGPSNRPTRARQSHQKAPVGGIQVHEIYSKN
jgi:hypothetical protein